MGKFRVRSKSAKKGQRWSKGQSSSSNPQKTRYRDAAKARSLATGFASSAPDTQSFIGNVPNRLTAESLMKHDVLLGTAVEHEGQEDTLTLGQTHKTFDTFASDWTQCTNMSFNKLVNRFNPNNAQHKEMLAILAAVTEVIKERGTGEESATEYFSALLTTLEATDSVDGLSATLTLLAMVIKGVPPEVLQKHFGHASKLFSALLQKQCDSEQTGVIRSLIGCLSVAMRAQSAFTWSQSSTMHVYQAILSYAVHPKPKVRKPAQHAVCAILRGSLLMTLEGAPDFHPAMTETTKFCLAKLTLTEESITILHTLTLLKEIISVMPLNDVKRVCEAILTVIQTKSHPHTLTCAMQALYGLFNSRPDKKTLSANLNAKLLTALYEYKPSINDGNPIVAWLTVQQEALVNLCNVEPELGIAHLPHFFGEAKKCWMSDISSVRVSATTALKAICNECMRPNIQEMAGWDNAEEILGKVFAHVKEGMGFQYHGAWAQVLHLLGMIFDVAGAHFPQSLAMFLPMLADQRQSDNFAFVNELDYVIGKAIRKMGPRFVLQHIDLQITGEETNYNFPRSWLLPVLRENIQQTELAFFIEYFLPLADRMRQKSNKCLNVDDRVGHKVYQVLEHQIWALLPGFCNAPTDLPLSFKKIARTVGEQLEMRKDIRMDILSSIRQLILKNLDNEENCEVLANFAKNFLPILCNLYTTRQPEGSEETGQHLAVYETIKQYVKVAPKDRLNIMFDKAFEKYNESNGFQKEATFNILRAYFPYQDSKRVLRLYESTVKQVESKNHAEQKKAYKFLEELCGSESEVAKQVIEKLLDEKRTGKPLQKVFLKSLSKASPSSQASRIKCLIHIIRRLSGECESHPTFAKSVIPEAILCIKAVNEKARSGAYTLLVVIGESLMKWSNDNEQALEEYITVVSAGLAGDPSLVHCTLLAITRIFFEFRDLLPDVVVDIIVQNVCKLLVCSAREVVGAGLSFLRVFIQVNPIVQTGRQEILEQVVKSVMNMTEDCKRHFRLKTRYLLERLVRKFGYDVIMNFVPVADQTMLKRLKNIKKAQARKQRNDQKSERDDSDEDDDDDFKIKAKPKTMDDILADSDSDNDEMDVDDHKARSQTKNKKKVKKPMQSFISDNSDGIIDFLDPSAAHKVSSVKPKDKSQAEEAKRSRAKNGGFEIGSDGRIIIRDSDDEEEDTKEQPVRKASYFQEDDSDVEDENTFKNLISTSSAARKRKAGGSISSKTTMKYEPGGSGIHRAVKKKRDDASSVKSSFGSEYRSSKAKGDVKRKDKPDPYAYVPLQKSSLNKRKKAKYEGQFKNLVKGAQKGASSGGKSKARLASKIKNMKI